jgi:hypothetical protein
MVWYYLLLLTFLIYDFGLKYADIITTKHVVWDSCISLLTILIPMSFLFLMRKWVIFED